MTGVMAESVVLPLQMVSIFFWYSFLDAKSMIIWIWTPPFSFSEAVQYISPGVYWLMTSSSVVKLPPKTYLYAAAGISAGCRWRFCPPSALCWYRYDWVCLNNLPASVQVMCWWLKEIVLLFSQLLSLLFHCAGCLVTFCLQGQIYCEPDNQQGRWPSVPGRGRS